MPTKTDVEVRTRTNAKSFVPRPYKVILLNDDETTMDFVVYILMDIFAKNFDDAINLMMKVHKQGRAVCGAYPKEIAQDKQKAVHEAAKAAGFPLRCEIEEE